MLASLAALVVALTTLSDSGRHGDAGRGVEVDATPDRSTPTSELVEPGAVPVAASRTESTGPDTRHSVQTPRAATGPKVAFGAIHGKVIDEEGAAIAQAKVFLFDIKPSSLGEDVYLLRDGDPPKPLFKAETDAEGTFLFDGLDPRKDWSLSVKHDAYEEWASEVSIPVPEGGHYPETIVLKPGQTLSGVVRDATTHQPLAGVTLAAENPWALTRPKHKRAQTRLEVKTGADGAYVFKNLGASPAQNRVLTISAPGYATQVHNNFMMVAFSQPGTRIKGNKQEQPHRIGRVQDFDLQSGHVIAGRVVGPRPGGHAGDRDRGPQPDGRGRLDGERDLGQERRVHPRGPRAGHVRAARDRDELRRRAAAARRDRQHEPRDRALRARRGQRAASSTRRASRSRASSSRRARRTR